MIFKAINPQSSCRAVHPARPGCIGFMLFQIISDYKTITSCVPLTSYGGFKAKTFKYQMVEFYNLEGRILGDKEEVCHETQVFHVCGTQVFHGEPQSGIRMLDQTSGRIVSKHAIEGGTA